MVSGPSSAFANSYSMFIAFRLLIGVAGAGVYDTGYTILLELTVKNYRAYAGNIFNISFTLGIIFLPLAAYFTYNWRQLQLALSAPMVLLVIHCWFLPESPRWLITSGKLEKAVNIIGTICRQDSNEPDKPTQVYFELFFFFFQLWKYFSFFFSFRADLIHSTAIHFF
ncbi:unnamed protein product [Nezara viridula]|uniref:Major facilitator superfamily (MFS) profile domain-containing protein n=1 Tax=Nezara viridula TaxID=85310 RepID=A0A9P0H2M1_NEZVI|nr:unnamed protein product [Nezara viridula]